MPGVVLRSLLLNGIDRAINTAFQGDLELELDRSLHTMF